MTKKISDEEKVVKKINEGNTPDRRLAVMYQTNKWTIYRIRTNINFYLDPLQNQPSYHINPSTERFKWKELDRLALEVFSRL